MGAVARTFLRRVPVFSSCRVVFFAAVAAGFVLRLAMPVVSPSPVIDVFAQFQESAQHLLEGLNPYTVPFSDVYRGTRGLRLPHVRLRLPAREHPAADRVVLADGGHPVRVHRGRGRRRRSRVPRSPGRRPGGSRPCWSSLLFLYPPAGTGRDRAGVDRAVHRRRFCAIPMAPRSGAGKLVACRRLRLHAVAQAVSRLFRGAPLHDRAAAEGAGDRGRDGVPHARPVPRSGTPRASTPTASCFSSKRRSARTG